MLRETISSSPFDQSVALPEITAPHKDQIYQSGTGTTSQDNTKATT